MSREYQTHLTQKKIRVDDSTDNWQLPLLIILFVSVIFVAIKTVVHRHESRSMFMQLQLLEKERDKLSAQWSRLKLEQGTMLNQVRVEQNARWDLGMKIPNTTEINIIREPVKRDLLVVDTLTGSNNSTVALGE